MIIGDTDKRGKNTDKPSDIALDMEMEMNDLQVRPT